MSRDNLIKALAEAHMGEYFKRNDLPGPGSTHNQIFEAGFRAADANRWQPIESRPRDNNIKFDIWMIEPGHPDNGKRGVNYVTAIIPNNEEWIATH